MNPPSLPLNDITELEHLRRCPICGSERLRLWRQGFDRLHGISTQMFTYSQCLGCSVIFLSQRPSESQIQSFYPDDYGPYRGGETSSKSPNASPFPFAKRLRGASTRAVGRSALFLKSGLNSIFPDKLPGVLQQFYTPSQRGLKMLDFGCGSDRFLNSAAEKGWDTIGLDFSPRAVEQVRQSGHKAILMSPTAWSDLEDSSLDFVRMNHVLEHLYDPTEVLRNIKLKMKEGAVLHISTTKPFKFELENFPVALVFPWTARDTYSYIHLHL
ncbi:MAG: class I SAM-dependent methyltransferase [Pyrinomonadaceae bacterium]